MAKEVVTEDPPRRRTRITTHWRGALAAETILAFAFGSVFCALLFYLLLRNEPVTNPGLLFVLRILGATSVAAIAAVLPGFLHLNVSRGKDLGIRAGGALAIFALVYTVNPPELLRGKEGE